MSATLSFIGRVQELATIAAAINSTGKTQIIFIQGPGGIGKTRLLEEVRSRMASGPVRMSQIIDFDDPSLFIPDNLERRIANQLSETAFADYMRTLVDLRQMENSGVSIASLNRMREQVQEAFFYDFNQLAKEQRIVLLFDTTDSIANREVWERLMQFVVQAQNSLFLLAGRNGDVLYNEVQNTVIQGSASLITLQSLREEKVDKAYLLEKQKRLHNAIDPQLAEKILHLAQGRPILIDLAIEWLSRDMPTQWLIEVSAANIGQHQEAFEAQLVRPVTQIRRSLDRLTLLLSRVYPLPKRALRKFLSLDEMQVQELFDEAKEMVFIKSLPDDRLSLHDEMRRMVNMYVWPEIDMTGMRRQRESLQAIEFLEEEIAVAESALIQLEKPGDRELSRPEVISLLFARREELENELWSLRIRRLHHILYTDLDAGVQTFIDLFAAATTAYRLSLRDNLFAEMSEYEARLSAAQKYEVNNRRGRYLFDQGRYTEARNLVYSLLASKLTPSQQIDNLILLANLEIRLGNTDKGIADFTQAVQISRDYQQSSYLVRALIGLGWAYRNQGNFSEALAKYTDAYLMSLDLNDNRETARVLNNMAYIHAYKGDRASALENCHSALRLWHGLQEEREIAITYSTLGEVYRRFSQWSEAQEYYERALAIFENEDDREWISTVRAGRAGVYIRQNALAKAESDLSYATEYGPSNLKPRVLHTQGQIFWFQGDRHTAADLFQRCFTVSEQMGNQEFKFRSFADLLDIQWENGEFEQWPEAQIQLERLFAGHDGEESKRLRGSSLRKLGDLAICAGAYDIALTAYQQGLPLIADYEVHEPYAIGQQVRITDTRLRQKASPELIQRLGKDMFAFWKEKGLVTKSQEALILFYGWQQEKLPHA